MTGDGIGGDRLTGGIDSAGCQDGACLDGAKTIVDSEIAAIRHHDIAASRLGCCKVDTGRKKTGTDTIGVAIDGYVAGSKQLVGDTNAAIDADIAVTCQSVCLQQC